MPQPRVAGLVLAGGRSSRFGGEKAVATLCGRPLLDWCARSLAGAGASVAVNARPGSETETLARVMGFPVLHDDPALPAGPLTGVTEGLAWAAAQGFDRLVTLPCDTPLVRADHVAALIAGLGEARAAYAVTDEGPQGLCAAWRVEVATALLTHLAAGQHPSVQGLLEEIGARQVRFADPVTFGNINRRDDLARLQERAA